ncbi:MAG: beta-galactosidase, partial [Phycisphaerales bacterium]
MINRNALLYVLIIVSSLTTITLSAVSACSSISSEFVGFVVHPHEGHTDVIDQYNVTAELSNVFLWRVKDHNSLEVDFEPASKWITQLYGYNRAAYPIIDTSVFHTSGWRAERTRQSGQFMTGSDSKEWGATTNGDYFQTWSSLYSPIFREDVLKYTDQLVEWVKKNDPNYKIPGYVNGAEWFMPGMVDYNPLGIAEFQHWLEKKYEKLENLNFLWGSTFEKWSDVDPPRGYLLGDLYVGMRTVGFGSKAEAVGCQYESQLFNIVSDSIYHVKAELYQKNTPRGLYGIKLDCYDKNNNLIKYVGDGQFYWADIPNNGKGDLSAYCRMPSNAVKARLKLKLMSPGTVHFIDPQIIKWPEQKNVLSEDMDSSSVWNFSSSNDQAKGQIKQGKNINTFILSIPQLSMPYKYTGLAW